MPIQGYLTFELEKQGKNKGTATRGALKDKIGFTAFDYEVGSLRDVATGQASGKRQHGLVRITKEWDANTPMLFQAVVTNERVKTAKFEFLRGDTETGAEQVYFQITLTGGAVTKTEQTIAEGATAPKDTKSDGPHMQVVSFSFDKISLEHLIDKTMAEDSVVGTR